MHLKSQGALVRCMVSERQLGTTQGAVPSPCHWSTSCSHLPVQMDKADINNSCLQVMILPSLGLLCLGEDTLVKRDLMVSREGTGLLE